MRDVKTEEIETDEVCDKCGSKMVIKWGKFGRFMACSGYPECKNTREIPPERPGFRTDRRRRWKRSPAKNAAGRWS